MVAAAELCKLDEFVDDDTSGLLSIVLLTCMHFGRLLSYLEGGRTNERTHYDDATACWDMSMLE